MRVAELLLQVRQAIPVRIAERALGSGSRERIQARVHFPLVAEPVAVRVRIPGIGAQPDRFIVVVQPVAVRVRGVGIRAVRLLLQVGQLIPVGIRRRVVHQRIQARVRFPAVRHLVPVRVATFRIGAAAVLLQMAQAIAIGILGGIRRIQRIQQQGPAQLIDVVDSVPVRIQRVGHVPRMHPIELHPPLRDHVRVQPRLRSSHPQHQSGQPPIAQGIGRPHQMVVRSERRNLQPQHAVAFGPRRDGEILRSRGQPRQKKTAGQRHPSEPRPASGCLLPASRRAPFGDDGHEIVPTGRGSGLYTNIILTPPGYFKPEHAPFSGFPEIPPLRVAGSSPNPLGRRVIGGIDPRPPPAVW